MPIRKSIMLILALTQQAGISSPAFSQKSTLDVPVECATRYEIGRFIHIGPRPFDAWLTNPYPNPTKDQLTLCLKINRCYWTGSVPESGLGLFSPVDNSNVLCSKPQKWAARTWEAECSFKGDAFVASYEAFVAFQKQLLQNVLFPCASNNSVPFRVMTLVRSPELVASIDAQLPDLCLTLFLTLAKVRWGAVFHMNCISGEPERQRFLEEIRSKVVGDSQFWVGATTNAGAFGVGLHIEDTSKMLDASINSIKVWGNLNEVYVRNWLADVLRMARREPDPVFFRDNPLPSASSTTYLGRLSTWLVAGMARVANAPFGPSNDGGESQFALKARDWMVRNTASFAGRAVPATILRGELARSDWNIR
jgi:hypothetical protein